MNNLKANVLMLFASSLVLINLMLGCGGGGGQGIPAPKPEESLPISSIQIVKIALQQSSNIVWTQEFNSGSSTSNDIKIDNGESISVYADVKGDELLTSLGREVKISVSGKLLKSDGTTKITDVTFIPSEVSTTIYNWDFSDLSSFAFTSIDKLNVDEFPVYLLLTWTIYKKDFVQAAKGKYMLDWVKVTISQTIHKFFPRDNIAPKVKIAQPKDFLWVFKGNVLVAATASDNVGVKEVWLEANYEKVSDMSFNATKAWYEFLWDTSGVGVSEQFLAVKAKDGDGNKSSDVATIYLVGLGTSDHTCKDGTDCDGKIIYWVNQNGYHPITYGQYLHPALVKGIIRKESNFNPGAFNDSSKAAGLMQLTPATQTQYGVTNPYDPDQNIDGGTRFFKHLYDLLQDESGLERVKFALGAYNAGLQKVLDSQTAAGAAGQPTDQWDFIIQFPPLSGLQETKDYVPSVINHARSYGYPY